LPSLTSSSRIGFNIAYFIPAATFNQLRSIFRRCWPESKGYDHAETVKGVSFRSLLKRMSNYPCHYDSAEAPNDSPNKAKGAPNRRVLIVYSFPTPHKYHPYIRN
jgi:hypothetical protein